MTIFGQILQYFLLRFMTFYKIVGVCVDIWKSKNRHIDFEMQQVELPYLPY